jgi:Protein of unknown function (DUF3563)
MNTRDAFSGGPRDEKPNSVVRRLGHWWPLQDAEERYLAAATDLADLERRVRRLERASGGPLFVTFNH